MYNQMTVEELLEAKEGENIQFKEAKNRFDSGEATKCCCALANCGGGKLVFGITDARPRQVVGSRAFEQPERTRKGLIDKLKVMVDFQLFEYQGKRVLVFDVASRPLGLPVQADGIAWWYEGDSLIPMPEEIRRRIYAEAGFDFSGSVCPLAVLSDLDETAIDAFRARWVDKSGNRRIMSLSTEQLLRDCEAITEEGITYAALALFGKRESLGKYRYPSIRTTNRFCASKQKRLRIFRRRLYFFMRPQLFALKLHDFVIFICLLEPHLLYWKIEEI